MGNRDHDPSGFLETLEKNYGAETCWGWVCEWIWEEEQAEPDEKCSLEEYLSLRAGNADEDKP